MTTLFQGPEWVDDKQRDNDAIDKYTEVYELLEKNRIYFNDILCNKLSGALEHYKEVIEKMIEAKNHEKRKLVGSLDLWKDAEKRANEIKVLRLELAHEFRELIGVR